MKKRFLIPSVGVGVLTALTIIGADINATNLADCNQGDINACKSLIAITGMHDQVTNPSFKKLVANAKKSKAAKPSVPVTPAKFQPNSYNVSNLALSCTNKFIKPVLRDPNSFRELDHGYTMTDTDITISVEYTATNGFGGRVRNTKQCTYTR